MEPYIVPVGDVLRLRAGAVRIRHQPPMPFNLAYPGKDPALLYLFRGRLALSHADAVALLRPGAPVEARHPEPIEVLAIAYEGERNLGPPGPRWCGAADASLRPLAEEIRRVLRDEGGADLRYVEALAESLLGRAVRTAGGEVVRRGPEALSPATLRRLIDYIDARIDTPLPIAELAAQAGLSRAHFNRAFRNAAGQTPHRFIQFRRLDKARAWIEQEADDLAHIAVRAGFSSHAHLSIAFRKAFGLTPSQHRRAVQAEAAEDAPRKLVSA
jgi:AraC-like DNA-binding protein